MRTTMWSNGSAAVGTPGGLEGSGSESACRSAVACARVLPSGPAAPRASAIEVRDGMLRLEAEVDVDLLERAAADARQAGTASAYRTALALYAGELLPENRYDDWADERRDELADLAAALHDELSALGAE